MTDSSAAVQRLFTRILRWHVGCIVGGARVWISSGRWANWFSDPDLFDCPECEDNLGRPYAAAAAAESYGRGYDQGKDKAYFELQVHWPGEHLAGCGCRPCLAVQFLVEKLLYQLAYAAALEQAAQDEDIARAAVAAASLDAARPGPSINRADLVAKEMADTK